MAKSKPDDGERKKTERNGPSKDDIQMAVNQQLQWNVKRDELNAQISRFRKGLKANGITLGLLDATVKMLEWEPGEIKADFEERLWYAEAMRFPVGAQLELFGTEKTPEPVADQLKWRNVGYKDGLAGRGWPDEPPEGCPTECHQEYGKGHEEGAEIVRQAFLKRQEAMGPLGHDDDDGDDADDAGDESDTEGDEVDPLLH